MTTTAASTQNKGKLIGYVRVSTLDQNTERQLEGMALDKVFTDKASGKDTLVCHSMDRLARNLDDLRRVVDSLTGKGIAVQFVKESMTFTGADSAMSRLMLSVMGAFAEFERSLIKERQREGIAIAKAKGVYKGRKPAMTPEQVEALRAQDRDRGGKNRSGLAKEHGISRETLYQYLDLKGTATVSR